MSKRPIITDHYNLDEYIGIDEYNCNLYLAYIKQLKKYLFILDKDETIFYYPIKLNTRPDLLYYEYGNDENEKTFFTVFSTKILRDRYNELVQLQKSGGLKEGANITFNNEIIDIIDDLTLQLKDLYTTDTFTSLKKFPKLKEFILDPVETYNFYTDNYNTKEINDDKVKKAKKEIDDLINKIIETKSNYNKYISDKWFNKRINNLVNSTGKDPFLSLNLGLTPTKRYQAQASTLIVNEFGLKRILLNNDNERLYLYNENLKYFDEVTPTSLKNKLAKRFGFNILESDINTVSKAVSTENVLYNNLLSFRNIYYDINTLDEFKPNGKPKYKREDYLTINNIGTLDENTQEINLLNYNKNLTFDDIIKPKELPEINPEIPVNEYLSRFGITLTEIVLRQILIPKNNQFDIRMFRDFLERLGSNIYGTNLYKVLTFYYGDGDNAKSILNLFINLIFNKLNYEIKPDDLKDGFNLENFYNRLIITIDEVGKNSFDELKEYLKQATSKYSKMEKRQIYSNKTFTLYNFPNINIYSNELLDLNPATEGALFSRIDYLKLPNKFVTSSELDKYENTYEVVDGLEDLLKKDTDGLSWLITAGILCFKEMKNNSNRYTLKQTREQTIDIFLNADYLTKFLMVSTEYVDELPREQFTSNLDITNSYLQYMANLNKTVDTENLAKTIGIKLSKLYPQLKNKENKYKATGNGATMYKLKLKEPEEINKQFNQAYTINEYVTDNQLNIIDTDKKYKAVYDKIQKGKCTISMLNKELPSINCYDIVQQLESLNLIYNTETIIINGGNS